MDILKHWLARDRPGNKAFARRYPDLNNFLGCNFPAEEFDLECDEEAVQGPLYPKEYYQRIAEQGRQALSEPRFPWKEISEAGNLHFEGVDDAYQWLQHIIDTLEEQLENDPGLSCDTKLRIWETNYGRDADWILERRGEPIALFTEPEQKEMFWYIYRVTPLTQDPELRRQMRTQAFWNEMDGLVWRSRELGIIAPNAFPGSYPPPETGRVAMRGLCINIGPPSPVDEAALQSRKNQS